MSVKTNIRKKRFIVDKNTLINVQTFRHDFGEQFMEELKHFAIIHKFDDRKVFKEAWTEWCTSNQKQISYEIIRLQTAGYEGDVLDKMFKSARYYFRKKPEKTKEKQRKTYISLSPMFLEKIDIYILSLIKNNSEYDNNKNIRISSISPANAYEEFCKNKTEIIAEQIKDLIQYLDTEEICIKFKKTFKNRFHVLKASIEKI
jgi:hypothetical protein